ncbi:MAG: radical SAM protein [Kiritimatiellae bacterium]|nr:radical SAM protein [Kiritimatiellia bacterium]
MSSGTLALVSLGCAKNAVDLQLMAGDMIKSGYTLSSDPDRADVVIVNTCSFIAAAREEAEAEILRALELKRRGRFGKVVVTGCYPQRYPGAAGNFPGVDEWIGVPKEWKDPAVPGLRFTGRAFAYLKIAEGCAHRCAYCAIPGIRGRYRSRPPEMILAEAQALLASGCRELNVIAQDPMLYGIDFKGSKRDRIGLSDLLWALDDLPGDFWIRVLYSYPNEISGEFLDWMNNSRHAVKYIDVPLQHTVPEVLERMNRGAAAAASLAAAETLRELVPGVTLRTTIMTGFPGETEARFRRLLSDLRRMQFDHLGAFAFSPEKGTASYSMSGRPSRATAEKREREVMDLAAKIWAVKSGNMIGSVRKALVVAPGVARMASQAPDVDGVVRIKGGEVGEFVKVKLAKAKDFDFIGCLEE